MVLWQISILLFVQVFTEYLPFAGTFLSPGIIVVKKSKFLFLRSLYSSARDIIDKHILLGSNKSYERL